MNIRNQLAFGEGKSIPSKSDAIVWLDGTISGNNFVDKISGRLFPITNKDFPIGWVKGFPYKSAATFSAPVADAALIASDLNNFFYTAGIPNQIQVTALFQNIDYENRLFARHMSQSIDLDTLIESYEPRVSELVLYANEKTGGELTSCNTYYSVPAKQTTNVVWITTHGDDATGNGTESLPYKTVAKMNTAVVADGCKVYIKGGIYSTTTSIAPTFSCDVVGLGNTQITTSSDIYIFSLPNANKNITIEGITINANSLGGCYFSGINTGVKLINRCGLVNNIASKYLLYNGEGALVTAFGSYFKSSLNTVAVYSNSTSMNACICDFNNTRAINPNAANKTLVIENCVLSNANAATGTAIIYDTRIATIKFNNNTIKINSNFKNVIRLLISGDSVGTSIIAKHNRLLSPSYTIDNFILNSSINTLFNIEYNLIDVLASTATIITLLNSYTGTNVSSNIITSRQTGNGIILLNNQTVNNSVVTINNNVVSIYGVGGKAIGIGLESTDSLNKNKYEGSSIEKNVVNGYYYFNPTATDTSFQHGIYAGFQDNVSVKYNKVHGCGYGAVIKSDSVNSCSGVVQYNLMSECAQGIYLKAINGYKVYNNTISNTSNRGSFGINLSQGTGTDFAINNQIKNNIIINTGNSVSALINSDSGSLVGLQSDYNCLFAPNSFIATIPTEKTFSELQDIGFEQHSINLNPLLTNLIPAINSPSIGISEDLGISYSSGLDASTNWGSESQLPVVSTKHQPTLWDCGAYIH